MADYEPYMIEHIFGGVIREIKRNLGVALAPPVPSPGTEHDHALVPYGSDHLKSCARCGRRHD